MIIQAAHLLKKAHLLSASKRIMNFTLLCDARFFLTTLQCELENTMNMIAQLASLLLFFATKELHPRKTIKGSKKLKATSVIYLFLELPQQH